jgi:hypothetical protein|tara:strand:+ start:1795 stop:1962 length:168 start_codon:yes stop_codon:yes gene_type:complete
MINVLLTIVWLGSAGQPDEILKFNTDSMEYCQGMAEQVIAGDGAVFAWCEYEGGV